jgi:transcriptional regulator with XRE-family HTH domain
MTKPELLRVFLSANMKARRESLGLSQEGLAELADVSVQMVKRVEGRQSWVSDKMLTKLAEALQVDAFQLLVPAGAAETGNPLIFGILSNLRQNIKDDIDRRFEEIPLSPGGT